MTFSDAIRKGAQQRPQCFARVFRPHPTAGMASCALGAAVEGTFGETRAGLLLMLKDVYPRAFIGRRGRSYACPACVASFYTIATGAAHLNDDHRWTREQIADWVETL